MKGNELFLSLVVAASTLMAAPATVAQTLPSDTITGKTHRIDDVTVTAHRRRALITSTVPVQQLKKEELQQLGLQNMADAVRRFAGANVKDYGGIGGLKTVSVRNMGAAHTAVSYDGVPVSNCQGGQIDIGRFSLDNIQMLSLAVGQQEEMLQPARLYASASVLSIETEKPHFDEGQDAAFRLLCKVGSFGYVTPSLRYWQQLGQRTSLAMDGTYLRADGNYPYTLVNGKYTTRERRNNSAIHSMQGEINLYHTLRDSSSLSLKGYYYYSKRGLPGSVTLYNPVSREKLWDENCFLQAQYRKTFSSCWSLKALAKYTHGWNRDTDYGNQYEGGEDHSIHRQDEYYLSAALLYRPTSTLSFSLAEDGALNKLRSNYNDCPFPTRYTSLSALHARYQSGILRADASLIYTYQKEQVEVGEAPDDFQRLAPHLSLSLKPWEDQELYLRLLYKSTFRTATFNDLYYYRLGNRHLRPEKANEYNVGITWNINQLPLVDYLTLTIDAYYNDVTDKIVAFPTTYAWRMANFGTVHATGVDVTLATTWPIARRVQALISGSYTYQRAIDLTDPSAKSYKDQLPYTPKHSGNASLLVETPWVNVGYTLVGVSERYCLAQNIPENRIDGYVEHTATLSRSFSLRLGELKVQVEAVNLTDCQYDVIKYYPMPGRSFRATLQLQF